MIIVEYESVQYIIKKGFMKRNQGNYQDVLEKGFQLKLCKSL